MMFRQIFEEKHPRDDSQDAKNRHHNQQFHQGYAALVLTISVQIGLALLGQFLR
jgi:hypothetical protein